MNFAVIKASGKQYKVTTGAILDIDKIVGEKGEEITFPDVLLIQDEKNIIVGNPVIKDAKVLAEIVDQVKGEKVRVGKFKAKSKYRRVTGFRSQLTTIEIKSVQGGKN